MPAHHKLEQFLDEYLDAVGIGDRDKTPVFRSAAGRTGTLTERALHRADAYEMVRRRAADTGLKSTTRRSFRTAASSFRASRYAWDKDVPPDDYFDEFKTSINLFSDALSHKTDHEAALRAANNEIGRAVASMNEDYEPSSSTSAPTASSTPQSTPLLNLFRDVDE